MTMQKPKRRISENVKAGLFRWWFTGAVYFFVAFGTSLGSQTSPVDLLFFLGVGLGLGTAVLFNPILFGFLNVRRPEGLWSLPYSRRKLWQNILLALLEVLRAWFLVLLVFMTYQSLNLLLQQLMDKPAGTIILRGEPILFATFYMIFYWALSKLSAAVRTAVRSAKNEVGKGKA